MCCAADETPVLESDGGFSVLKMDNRSFVVSLREKAAGRELTSIAS